MRVRKTDFDEPDRHGFQILDGDRLLLTFEWHDTPAVIRSSRMDMGKKGPRVVAFDYELPRTTYSEVLDAIPARFKEMGLDEHTDKIVADVKRRFSK